MDVIGGHAELLWDKRFYCSLGSASIDEQKNDELTQEEQTSEKHLSAQH